MKTQSLAAILALALCASAPAMARDNLTPIQADVASQLPNYGFHDVDVRSLSSGKLAHIHHLLYSNKSVAQIRGNIGAVLGDSLISTIFK
jgi:hypothetical protein